MTFILGTTEWPQGGDGEQQAASESTHARAVCNEITLRKTENIEKYRHDTVDSVLGRNLHLFLIPKRQ